MAGPATKAGRDKMLIAFIFSARNWRLFGLISYSLVNRLSSGLGFKQTWCDKCLYSRRSRIKHNCKTGLLVENPSERYRDHHNPRIGWDAKESLWRWSVFWTSHYHQPTKPKITTHKQAKYQSQKPPTGVVSFLDGGRRDATDGVGPQGVGPQPQRRTRRGDFDVLGQKVNVLRQGSISAKRL